jgi:hypothetical protein
VEVHNDCLLDDPDVYIKDSVCTIKESRHIPIIIKNQSNRPYKIPRAHIVGRVTATDMTEIFEIQNDRNENEMIKVVRNLNHQLEISSTEIKTFSQRRIVT